jgi:hypothetical protein
MPVVGVDVDDAVVKQTRMKQAAVQQVAVR